MKVFRCTQKFALLLMSSLLLIIGQITTISTASAHTSIAVTHLQSTGKTICLQPPQNIDLMTLTDAQLDSYGLPTHSILDRNPKQWSARLAHAKHRTCGSYPDPLKRTHHFPSHQSNSPNSCFGCPSVNWAGNVDTGARGTYRDGSVTVTVPNINGALSNSNSDGSYWVGVGGDSYITSPAEVVQAGVDTYKACSACPQYNTSWWEVYPNIKPEQDLPLCRLNTGDQVYSFIDSNDNNNGKDYFYISNVSANCYNSHTETNQSYFSDSATGECIAERTGNNSGGYYSLPDFGTEQFSGCTIDTNTRVDGVGNYTHIYHYMTSDGTSSGRVLAYPGPITNSGYDFPVYWKGGA